MTWFNWIVAFCYVRWEEGFVSVDCIFFMKLAWRKLRLKFKQRCRLENDNLICNIFPENDYLHLGSARYRTRTLCYVIAILYAILKVVCATKHYEETLLHLHVKFTIGISTIKNPISNSNLCNSILIVV